MEIMSDKNQRQLAWLLLTTGVLALAAGFIGLWMQGRMMYDGSSLRNIADCLCFQDVFASLWMPAVVLSVGTLSISWVILGSKLTENFSAAKRNSLFLVLAATVLTGCLIPTHIAATQDWNRAQAAANDYFDSLSSNAPAAKLEK